MLLTADQRLKILRRHQPILTEVRDLNRSELQHRSHVVGQLSDDRGVTSASGVSSAVELSSLIRTESSKTPLLQGDPLTTTDCSETPLTSDAPSVMSPPVDARYPLASATLYSVPAGPGTRGTCSRNVLGALGPPCYSARHNVYKLSVTARRWQKKREKGRGQERMDGLDTVGGISAVVMRSGHVYV